MIKLQCPSCLAAYPPWVDHACPAAGKPASEARKAAQRQTKRNVTRNTPDPSVTVTRNTSDADRFEALEARVAALETLIDGKPSPASSRAEYMKAYRARKRGKSA